jgi:hypothetical protein
MTIGAGGTADWSKKCLITPGDGQSLLAKNTVPQSAYSSKNKLSMPVKYRRAVSLLHRDFLFSLPRTSAIPTHCYRGASEHSPATCPIFAAAGCSMTRLDFYSG